MTLKFKGADADRVRARTQPQVLREIDREIEANIRYYAAQPREVISRRIVELDREWDIERFLETNASSIAIAGLLMGMTVNRKWLLVTGGVLGFLLMHAVKGWCPPLPLLRRFGVRTRREIDRERFALKILRGDFQMMSTDPAAFKSHPTDAILNAID
ncbi:MAG: hypothetical protein SFY81_00465 [Verrucomicrobiota bacterium]|nr:hypothetical protein [Verrucomicrobiota bacterium]